MKNKQYVRNDVDRLAKEVKKSYDNKYYNLFMGSFDTEGLTSDEKNFILKTLWKTGTIACFPIKLNGEIIDKGFTTYNTTRYNMYDLPAELNLTNNWNMPFIPMSPQKVGLDVVIGYVNPNHKGIKETVDYFISRLVQVEMVINQNLQLHKIPFLVGVTPQDEAKAKDIIDKILAGEIAIFADLNDLNLVKALATNTPFIMDKLYSYKVSLENELMTILGVDNAMEPMNGKQWSAVDEINANNQLINTYRETMNDCLKEFTDSIKEVFNIDVVIKSKQTKVASVHQEQVEEVVNE